MYQYVYIDGVLVIAGPPGYKVNLAHPTQKLNFTAYAVFAIGVPLSTFCLAQYMYVKLRILRRFDIQLVCLVLGWIMAVAMACIQVENFAEKSIGVHIWEMPVMRAVRGGKMLVAVTTLNAVTTGLCKTSLGLFYYHISPETWWKRANFASVFLMAGYNIAIFFCILLGCRPIQKNWIPTMPGVCINRPALYIARACLGVLSDLILIILPIPMILRTQMPTRQKIGVIFFFALGSVTLVTAALRVVELVPTLRSRDATWVAASSAIIILSESQLMVICAALPTLKQFFAHVSPHFIGERGSSAKSSKSSGERREIVLHAIKTIGRSMNRKKVDEFGMTIDDDVIGLTTVESHWDIETGTETRSERDDYGEGQSTVCSRSRRNSQTCGHREIGLKINNRYDSSWLEAMCERSFNMSSVENTSHR